MGKKLIHEAQGSLMHYEQIPEHEPYIVVGETLPDAVDNGRYMPEAPTHYGPEGSYVDVGERAQLLKASLKAIAAANQSGGLEVAANTQPTAKKIYHRYAWRTEEVVEGSKRNGLESAEEAKVAFWRATGYAGLRGAGLGELITRDGINARARKDWRDFTNRYGYTGREVRNARRRLDYRLNKTINRFEHNNE